MLIIYAIFARADALIIFHDYAYIDADYVAVTICFIEMLIISSFYIDYLLRH